MAETPGPSGSEVVEETHDAEQQEMAAATLQPEREHLLARELPRELPRAFTQPRGLFESMIESYGPITAPPAPEVEEEQIEIAYRSLPASDISDAGTSSSHDEGGPEARTSAAEESSSNRIEGRDGSTRARSRGRAKNRPQKLSDEEWAKSILSRPTGYGSVQRDQVGKYILQIESRATELQIANETSTIQIDVLRQHRVALDKECSKMKEKIAYLEQLEPLQEDKNRALEEQNEALEEEVQYFTKMCALQQQLISEQPWIPNLLSDEIGPDIDRTTLTSEDPVGASFRDANEEHSIEAQGSCRNEEGSRESRPADPSAKDNSEAGLVRWPSTLYRSVSAIKKDLDVPHDQDGDVHPSED